MHNQGNMRLHVDLFIKYVSNNIYSDNNLGQPQSILNNIPYFFQQLILYDNLLWLIFGLILISLFFFVGRDENEWVGGIGQQFFFFFYLVGSPKVGGAGDGKHTKKYGHPKERAEFLRPVTEQKVRHCIKQCSKYIVMLEITSRRSHGVILGCGNTGRHTD